MLNFKKRIWAIKQKEKGQLTDSQIASAQNVTRRAIQKIWTKYKLEGLDALRDKPKGRKPTATSEDILNEILKLRKDGYGIRRINGLLKQRGLHVPIKRIHNELRRLNLVKREPKKGKRYKYIRWERKHSNSLWQTDYCYISKLECWLCAWLDDHSRFITAADYFTEATTENVLSLFDKASKRYGLPKQTLSDRGTQFYAVRGESSRFKEYLSGLEVEHIYASIKKPTTCGKLER
jgi:putative transposase